MAAKFFHTIITLIILLSISSYPKVNIDNYIGLNYIENYKSPPHQNWCVLQDKRGIIYVANHGGVLEFDGVSWRSIDVPNKIVRSLSIDDNGIIYVGGFNEFGCLAPAPGGALRYVSLLDHLSESQKNFSQVWKTHAVKNDIYFVTRERLYRWDTIKQQIKVWESDGSIIASFTCNNTLFIQQENVGLMQMVDDSLELIIQNESLGAKKIFMMVPFDNNKQKLLIGTWSGFYLYNGVSTIPFRTMVDDYLEENQLYHGIRLVSSAMSRGDFAVATLRGGLMVFDAQGKLIRVFTKASGLQNNSVKYIFEDFQGNLWLALEKGISKIEYASPISVYDDNRSDIPGLVLSVTRHGMNNDLYVGTTHGLYYLTMSSPVKFRHINGISSECFSLLSLDNSLLAATKSGVFQVKNYALKDKVTNNISLVLHRSQTDANRIWVGTSEGIEFLQLKNDQWTKEYLIERIKEPIKSIVEDREGNFWLGSLIEGVLKVNFPVDSLHPVVIRYDTHHKLPQGAIRVFWAVDRVMFATEKGLYRFDKKQQVFLPDNIFGDEFADGSRNVWRIAEDKNKHIWFHSDNRNFQAIPQGDGTFAIEKKPFLRMSMEQVNEIYVDPDEKTIWFARNDGLIRYNTRIKKNYRFDFSTFIRKVVINGSSVIFDGSGNEFNSDNDWKPLFPAIAYEDRNIRFEFAAPFFEEESKTEYQYVLAGYDQKWSDWDQESQKEYRNLDSGTYHFQVRARNVYEDLSAEADFEFRVLLPWYKTWWAVLSYFITFFLLTYLISKWWRSRKLEQEKQRLEQLVKNRTKEINHKNRQLEEQSEKLKDMDKVKSRFFANISHEFRTPLTLIMGPLEQMLSGTQDKEMERKINLMLRNSQRLLNLINQLLDLSKFDSGRMKLQAVRQHPVPFLKGMVESFELAALQHEVDLTFQCETENITLYFDTEKLENVMCNLLINAIKFTPAGGKVTVSVAVPSPDFVEISVQDTGTGIPGDQLEHIFDRFFQVEEPSRDHHLKGTGIGLALTKELVNLHHGRLDVHSRVGEPSGTEFIIRLPIGKAHLKPEEIIESPENQPAIPDNSPSSPMIKSRQSEIAAQEITHTETEGYEIPLSPDSSKPGLNETQHREIILVVEDNPDVREYIRSSLEPAYTVREAKDGGEGINKAKEVIPDLIISDVMMPGLDGYELCRVLKKEVSTCHIPIILLTAKASDDNILEGLAAGVDDYITKPFNTKILCARIKNLIDLRHQLQQNLKREMTFQPVKTSLSEIDRNFLIELQRMIEKNLSDPDFNVEQLGKKLYMSRATLYRKIHALTGETPTEYIRTYRLKRGVELLKRNFGTVLEVAMEVGFSSSAYFTKCFKEKFHQLPSEFQATEAQ